MKHQKILLVGGPVVLASAIGMGLILSPIQRKSDSAPRSQISVQGPTEILPESATPAITTDYLAEQARAAGNSSTEPVAGPSRASNYAYRASGDSTSDQTSRNPEESISSGADEPPLQVNETYLPFVFLDHSQAVPATEEAAAAIQRIQKDFIEKSGAATAASPADPNYAQSWVAAQALADEQFYARFGAEAYSAMWASRVRELGHF